MKTPRELLLQRHRAAEPKLDQMRQGVVAQMLGNQIDASLSPLNGGRAEVRGENVPNARPRSHLASWPQFLLSIRWHLAGMSAVWLLVVLLNIDHTPAAIPPVTARKAEPAPQLLTALRENRRQLWELITGEDKPAALPLAPVPSRRSEIQTTNTLALA